MPLKLKADLGQLSRIRDFVTDTATDLGVVPASFDDLRLAVDEAVTNVLTHGYGGPGNLQIELTTEGPDLFIRLCDQAPTFDPALAPAPDLTPPGERENPGGFGVFLMKSVMDEILHRQSDCGNQLTMIKRDVVDTREKTNDQD